MDTQILITWNVLPYGKTNQEGDNVLKEDQIERVLCGLFYSGLKISHQIATATNKSNKVVGTMKTYFRIMDKQTFMQL